MPKPLHNAQPTSSVAGLLQPGVGASVTRSVLPSAGVPAFPPAGMPEPPRTGEPANVKREFVLTPGAETTLRQVLALFEQATGAKLTHSHLLRAVLTVLEHALPDLEREAARLGPMKRPSNARGAEAERDDFERRLAAVLRAGVRACPPTEV